MKQIIAMQNVKTVLFPSVFLISGLIIINPCFAQKSNNSKFIIQINENLNLIHLTGKKGCEWTNLMFSFEDDEIKYIDNTGVYVTCDFQQQNETSMPNPLQKKQKNFIIAIKKSKGEIKLIGYKGTKWENLGFYPKNKDVKFLITDNGLNKK